MLSKPCVGPLPRTNTASPKIIKFLLQSKLGCEKSEQ